MCITNEDGETAPFLDGATRKGASNRERRLHFTKAWDILLLTAITMCNGHNAPYRELQARFTGEALHWSKSLYPRMNFNIAVEQNSYALIDLLNELYLIKERLQEAAGQVLV